MCLSSRVIRQSNIQSFFLSEQLTPVPVQYISLLFHYACSSLLRYTISIVLAPSMPSISSFLNSPPLHVYCLTTPSSRYGGIKVGWKKIQRNIGHFLVLVECISMALSYKRKKFTVQFFNN